MGCYGSGFAGCKEALGLGCYGSGSEGAMGPGQWVVMGQGRGLKLIGGWGALGCCVVFMGVMKQG